MSPQRPSPDVKAELFELLFRTLHHNWRYFFKSTVLASVQRGIAEEQMENEPQFSAIMQVMCQSCRNRQALFWMPPGSTGRLSLALLLWRAVPVLLTRPL